MIIKECDRCGKRDTDTFSSSSEQVQKVCLETSNSLISADLCETCLKQVEEYMTRIPNKMNNPVLTWGTH